MPLFSRRLKEGRVTEKGANQKSGLWDAADDDQHPFRRSESTTSLKVKGSLTPISSDVIAAQDGTGGSTQPISDKYGNEGSSSLPTSSVQNDPSQSNNSNQASLRSATRTDQRFSRINGSGTRSLVRWFSHQIRPRRKATITRVINHPHDVLEIQFLEPSFKYKPGQWLFLQVPSISNYEWRPFPITSCPFDSHISVHVPPLPGFNTDLKYALSAGPAQAKLLEGKGPSDRLQIALQNGNTMPRLCTNGPYNILPGSVFNEEVVILIADGFGMAAWASILKQIWHLRNGSNSPPRIRLRRLELLWICEDSSSLEWFQALLSALETQDDDMFKPRPRVADFLRIHVYLTQEFDIDTINNITLNSVRANTDPLTGLKSFTNFGRPNFLGLFKSVRESILDGAYPHQVKSGRNTTVSVYFYGSSKALTTSSLGHDIDTACTEATVEEVVFRFWMDIV